MPVIKQKIMPDSIVYTDSLSSYDKPGVSGFIHYRINNQRSFSQAASSTAPFFTAAVSAVAISAYGRFYSGLNLNQYGVASPCRTICTVCGFVALS